MRGGFGGGVAYLGVHRATTDSTLGSLGLVGLGRLGWDAGEHAYVLLDLEAQLQAVGALPFGPTLQVGARF